MNTTLQPPRLSLRGQSSEDSTQTPEISPLNAILTKRLRLLLSKRTGLTLALWGEPGIGKTHLAQTLLKQALCRKASVHASDYRQLASDLPRPKRLLAWAERNLEKLEHTPLDTAVTADTLVALLNALSPFVLHIDDMHEAEPEELELWKRVASAVTQKPGVGLIITSHEAPAELFETELFEAYRLEPLSTEANARMLEAEAQAALPQEAQRWIYQRTKGNPLYSLEYFRFLARQGFLWSDGKCWRWREPDGVPMPTSVEALLARHLMPMLDLPLIGNVLATTAVLRGVTSNEVIAACAGLELEVLTKAQRELERRGIFRGNATAHPLFCAVIRREMPPAQRCQLARRALGILKTQQPELAFIFIADAQLNGEEALQLLKDGAAYAQTSGNNHAAASCLTHAVNYAQGAERARLALEAARLMRNVNLTEARRLADLARRESANEVKATLLYADVLNRLGRTCESREILEAMPEDQRPSEAWLATLMTAYHTSHHYEQALALWQKYGDSTLQTKFPFANYIGYALVRLRHFEEATTFVTGVLKAQLEPLELVSLQLILAQIPYFAGNLEKAEQRYTEVIKHLNTLSSYDSLRFYSLCDAALECRAYARIDLGRYDAALKDINAALGCLAEIGNAHRYAQRQSDLGLCYLQLGHYERAEEVLLESYAVLERGENPLFLARVQAYLARLYLEWSPAHGGALALKYAQSALAHARQADSPPYFLEVLATAAWAEACHGQAKQALKYVQELETLAIHLKDDLYVAHGTWVQALALERLHQKEAAIAVHKEALEGAKRWAGLDVRARWQLELERMTGDRASAAVRIAHLEKCGQSNTLQVAYRYFPDLAPTEETPADKASAQLQLDVLGPLKLSQNDEVLAYRAQKGKELLTYLLERRIAGKKEATQLELIDTFYSELPHDKATAALKQLVYRLRSGFGNEVVASTPNGYALGAVTSDAEAFLASGQGSLWRGPYLEDIGEGWDLNARSALYHKLVALTNDLLLTNPQEALRLSRVLVEAHPYEQQHIVLVLQAFEALNQPLACQRFYREARTQFVEVGESLPPDYRNFQLANR